MITTKPRSIIVSPIYGWIALKLSPISTPPAPASAPERKDTIAAARSGVDPHQLRRIRLLRHRADRQPQPGAPQQRHQPGHQHDRGTQDQQLRRRDPDVADMERLGARSVSGGSRRISVPSQAVSAA